MGRAAGTASRCRAPERPRRSWWRAIIIGITMKGLPQTLKPPEWERDRVRVYGLPRALTELLRNARAGKFDVLVTMGPTIISPDPDAVAATEAVLRAAGVAVEYAARPGGRTRPGQRACLYARDLAKTEGVTR